jgi:hypothetical protein
MIDKLWRWFMIRGLIGMVVFLLSTAVGAIVPGLVAAKVASCVLGWVGGRVASHLDSRSSTGG